MGSIAERRKENVTQHHCDPPAMKDASRPDPTARPTTDPPSPSRSTIGRVANAESVLNTPGAAKRQAPTTNAYVLLSVDDVFAFAYRAKRRREKVQSRARFRRAGFDARRYQQVRLIPTICHPRPLDISLDMISRHANQITKQVRLSTSRSSSPPSRGTNFPSTRAEGQLTKGVQGPPVVEQNCGHIGRKVSMAGQLLFQISVKTDVVFRNLFARRYPWLL